MKDNKDRKIRKVKKQLAGGELTCYHYAYAGGPRFWIGPHSDGHHTLGYSASLAAALAPPPPPRPPTPSVATGSSTVSDVIVAWKSSAEWSDKAPRTQADYERGLRDLEVEFGPDDAQGFFNRPDLCDIVCTWIEGKWKRKEADYRLDAAKGLCSWLSQRKRAVFPKSQLYGTPKYYRTPNRADVVWTKGEVALFCSTARRELADTVVFARETSGRIGDLVGLSLDNVHDRSDGGKALIYKTGKGRRYDRIANIPLTPTALEIVNRTPEGQATILLNSKGRAWLKLQLSKKVRAHANKIGIRKSLRFNDLRGSKCTELVWHGHLSAPQLALHMGWSLETAAKMMTIYASLNPDALTQSPLPQG